MTSSSRTRPKAWLHAPLQLLALCAMSFTAVAQPTRSYGDASLARVDRTLGSQPPIASPIRRVTIDLNDVALPDALRAIAAASGLSFVYVVEQIPANRRVTLRANAAPLANTLTDVLRGTGLTFEEGVGNRVVLRPAAVVRQRVLTGAIAGTVRDARGVAVASAFVSVVGTARSGTSDVRGQYRIVDVPAGQQRVAVRYLGFSPDTASILVRDGTTVVLDIALRPSAVTLSGVNVMSEREGQARALNQQRNADNISNVVAQEQIERFADQNIAAGVRRVPGITITNNYGEPSEVYMRGLGSSFNSYLIDGERIPATSTSGRGTDLGSILSDMVGSIEVNKSLTADMDADAIGGSINLVTKRATADRPLRSLSAGLGYNAIASGSQGEASGTIGQRVGRFGYLFNGSLTQAKRAEQSLHYVWGEAEGTTSPTDLESWRLYNYQIDRKRYGGSAVIDYDLNDRGNVYARAMISRYDEGQYTPQTQRDMGKAVQSTPGSFTGASESRTSRDRPYNTSIETYAIGGKQGVGKADLDANASISRAMRDQPSTVLATFAATRDFSLNTDELLYPDFKAIGGSGTNATPFTFKEVQNTEERTEDQDVTGSFNIRYPLSFSSVSTALKFGGKVRDKTLSRTRRNRVFRPKSGTVLSLDDFAKGGFGDALLIHDRYAQGAQPDPTRVLDYINANPTLFNETVDLTRQLTSYDASERVTAGYALLTATKGRLSTSTGVRYEHTSLDYTGNGMIYDTAGVYLRSEQLREARGYGTLSPMVNLRYALGANTNVRAAATRTLARPDYASLAPYSTVNEDSRTISRGNPALAPAYAVNLDLLAEHYLPSVGQLFGGVFHKSIDGLTVTTRFRETQGAYAGYDVQEPINAGESSVWGLEAGWQSWLTFLPGPLSGLGMYVNYTYSDSELRTPGDSGRKVPMPNQIPQAANFALLYEKYGISTSLAVNHQSRVIQSLGASSNEDGYFGRRTQFDLVASYQIRPSVRLYSEINNLTDEPHYYYVGNRLYPQEHALYSRWGTVGVRFNP